MLKIIRNSARCLHCKQEVVSHHTHDFKKCECGSVAVDGGKEYIRRVGIIHSYIDTSIYAVDNNTTADDNIYLAGKYIVWSATGKTNPSTVFSCREHADMAAQQMGKEHGVRFFVCQVGNV